jgi:hypothetical protein
LGSEGKLPLCRTRETLNNAGSSISHHGKSMA